MKALKNIIILTAVLNVSFAVGAFGQLFTTKKIKTAKELWNTSVTKDLILSGDAIKPDYNLLIENDASSIGSIRAQSWDTISFGKSLRKRLNIPEVPVYDAIIAMMVYPVLPAEPMSGGKLKFIVNGHTPIVYEVRHFWTSVKVPVRYLRKGINTIDVTVDNKEVVFKMPVSSHLDKKHQNKKKFTDSEGSGRSIDSGKTWKRCAGEYPIRLKLKVDKNSGILLTPVIDLAERENEVLIKPVAIRQVKIDVMLTDAGKHNVYYRSGNTHKPEAGSWTGWEVLTKNLLPKNFRQRFIQLKINLKKKYSNSMPCLNALSVESSWKYINEELSKGMTLREVVNNPVRMSSFPFEYENPDYYSLQEFRRAYKLDSIVRDDKTEFDKIKRLRGWVSGLWDWYLPDVELPDMITWDARKILDKGIQGDHNRIGGYCLQYAIVFAQACQSFGFPARIVTLNYSIWGGHEVTEVWSRDYGKWIMMDAQFDAMFYDKKTLIPLNALELHKIFMATYYPGKEKLNRDTWTIEDREKRSEKVISENLSLQIELGGNANSGKLSKDYVWWKVSSDNDSPGYSGGYGFFNAAELRWLPRSNWLSKPTPMPVTHGRTHWGWDGYYCWAGPNTPETPEHKYFVYRKSDIYEKLFTVNFSATVIDKGILEIAMTTQSPGFKNYEINDNGSRVVSSLSSYTWKLEKGKNILEMRTKDVMGNYGPPSRLVILYEPDLF